MRIPVQCCHPGKFISDEIAARGWSTAELAKRISRKQVIEPSWVQELIDGKRNITPMMAFGLHHAFGTSVELWINLQAAYDEWRKR